jgi:hypothetical protein
MASVTQIPEYIVAMAVYVHLEPDGSTRLRVLLAVIQTPTLLHLPLNASLVRQSTPALKELGYLLVLWGPMP